MTVLSPAPFPSQPAAEKASLLRSAGFLPVPGALEPPVVARLAAALDRVYQQEVARGRIGAGEPMHLLGEIGRVDAFLDLLDHPAVFPVIWGELGWNIHLSHRASASVASPRCAGSCWASPPAATTNGDCSATPYRCTKNSIDKAYWILPCQPTADTKCEGPSRSAPCS